MSAWQRNLTCLCGLLGPAILIANCVVSALTFQGKEGESYSFLNHFVSELGFVGVSKMAGVFNGCQTMSGVIIAVFMAGLAWHYRTRLAGAAAVSGMVSGILFSLIGRIPMNDLMPHLAAALSFFFFGFLTVGLFILVLALDRKNKLPKWLLVPGLISFASFAAFLAYPLIARQTPAQIIQLYRTARPDIWAIAIIEWMVLVSVMTWVILMSGCLFARWFCREGT